MIYFLIVCVHHIKILQNNISPYLFFTKMAKIFNQLVVKHPFKKWINFDSLKSWENSLHVFFRTCQQFCFLPTVWDTKSDSLEFTKNKVQLAVCASILGLNAVCTVGAVVQMCTVSYEKLGTDATAKFLLDSLSRVYGLLVMTLTAWKIRDTVTFFNLVYHLHKRLKRKLCNGAQTMFIPDYFLTL